MTLQAIILAGGLGTRLRSVVSDRPKVLASVGEKPFLDILLENLAKTKLISEVVLALGYGADQIAEYYQNKKFPFSFIYSEEKSPLGTGGATRLAFEKITQEEALVLNGDSFIEFDLQQFADFYRSKSGLGALLLTPIQDRAAFGSVVLNAHQQIISFEEKGQQGPGLINAGVYLLQKKAVLQWPLNQVFSIEKEILPELARQSPGLFGLAVEPRFIDIGTPDSYQSAQKFFS